MTVFEINILSDFVCPWCYIGKRRLDKAIRLYKKTYPSGSLDTFVLRWEPYYLDPDAPHVGIPWTERLTAKYDHERAQAVKGRLRQLGLGEGISFSFDCRIGSTRDAHRLIELAKTKEVEMQTVIMDGLFEAYFERDADMTDLALLSKVGVAAGLDYREVINYLESDRVVKKSTSKQRLRKMGMDLASLGTPCRASIELMAWRNLQHFSTCFNKSNQRRERHKAKMMIKVILLLENALCDVVFHFRKSHTSAIDL